MPLTGLTTSAPQPPATKMSVAGYVECVVPQPADSGAAIGTTYRVVPGFASGVVLGVVLGIVSGCGMLTRTSES